MNQSKRIAIVAALEDEIAQILSNMTITESKLLAGRKFWLAVHHDREVVVVLSGIGKVAAAITTVCLIENFEVSQIVYTGVAGAVSEALNVGDIVVGTRFIQHDMDASPLFPRFVVPGYPTHYFEAEPQLAMNLKEASEKALMGLANVVRFDGLFKLRSAQVHSGTVLSGDQFISSSSVRDRLRREHPGALAVEMEGAAVAQVCKDYGTQFGMVRTVSDSAEEQAEKDFSLFLSSVASQYSALIIKEYLKLC
jgi:adenosylhomocysteine nucleosidase